MNKQIYEHIVAAVNNNQISWLVTVIAIEGSAPGNVGGKMIVAEEKIINGTIGGGAIEKRVLEKIMSEQPKNACRWSFDLGGNFVAEKTGMLCNGKQEVLIEPLFHAHNLYIIGSGHCGRALSEFAARCDFNVTVLDERSEYLQTIANSSRIKTVCVSYDEIEKHIKFAENAMIVVMTHSHKHDETVLRKILPNQYLYFGVIGSKSKANTILQRLLQDGFAREQLEKVFLPIGINIGSRSPDEIAISILTQLIAVKYGIKSLSFNSNPLLFAQN